VKGKAAIGIISTGSAIVENPTKIIDIIDE